MSKRTENFLTEIALASSSLSNSLDAHSAMNDAARDKRAMNLTTRIKCAEAFRNAPENVVSYVASVADVESIVASPVKIQDRTLDVARALCGLTFKNTLVIRNVARIVSESAQSQRDCQDHALARNMYPDANTRHARVRNVLRAFQMLRITDDTNAIRNTKHAQDAIATLRG